MILLVRCISRVGHGVGHASFRFDLYKRERHPTFPRNDYPHLGAMIEFQCSAGYYPNQDLKRILIHILKIEGYRGNA